MLYPHTCPSTIPRPRLASVGWPAASRACTDTRPHCYTQNHSSSPTPNTRDPTMPLKPHNAIPSTPQRCSQRQPGLQDCSQNSHRHTDARSVMTNSGLRWCIDLLHEGYTKHGHRLPPPAGQLPSPGFKVCVPNRGYLCLCSVF